MKKFLIITFFSFFLIALIFLSQPQIRHIFFNGIIQFPQFVTLQAMKSGLVIRDFDRVLPWLERQLKIASYYGKSKNKMSTGLLENTRKAFKFAVLKEEQEKFIPLLEKIYLLNGDNIDLNLMLAASYKYSDKTKALEYLEKALKILPSDIRIFQTANIILREDKGSLKRKWCDLYEKSQMGDYQYHEGSSLLGIGYRRLAFEYQINNVNKIALNEGLQLGEKVNYEFLLDGSSYLTSPSLRVSNGGGIEIAFHKIEISSQGRIIESYDIDSIELYPETGFVLDNKVISTNKMGENIYFEILKENEYFIDKIGFELSIKKLPINNSSACTKE
tara:strand:- start:12422 stop:13417 length:996 start_codon:yes stop_codon:yes gene_type:complete